MQIRSNKTKKYVIWNEVSVPYCCALFCN